MIGFVTKLVFSKAGAVIGFAIACLIILLVAFNSGKRSVYRDLQEDRIQAHEDRRKIDDKVNQANNDELCAMLDGCSDG